MTHTHTQNRGFDRHPPVGAAAHLAQGVVERQPVEGGTHPTVKNRAQATATHILTHKIAWRR